MHPMTNMFCGTQEVLQKPETEHPRESGKLHQRHGGLNHLRLINDTQRAPVWHEVPAAVAKVAYFIMVDNSFHERRCILGILGE